MQRGIACRKGMLTTRIWQVYCDILKIGGSLLEFSQHKIFA